MLKIKSNYEIQISKGDSFGIDMELFRFKERYTLQPGETVYFNISKLNLLGSVLEYKFTATEPTDRVMWTFDTPDMERLEVGRYLYDIRIESEAINRKFYLINPTYFTVVDTTE